ncbi:MAG: hypothetical protein NC184_02810 [Roseburia sp.]|nr:hypothetical protein [Roseburia sp.]
MARRTTRSSSTFTLKKFSFWLVIVIGFAMLAAGVFSFLSFDWCANVARWIERICYILALIVPVLISFDVARSKTTVWFVLWIIFTVLILFGIISSIIAML